MSQYCILPLLQKGKKLLKYHEKASDNFNKISKPSEVIDQIKRCRLVVTGSYHGAVFSLAQGIPAICIANTTYYLNKFLGLKDFYKGGCEVILADDVEFSEKLTITIDTLWKNAENLRPDLLSSSTNLINESRSAYLKLYESLLK